MKRPKTFKDISKQTERIWSLYHKGYGTKKMFEFVEQTFLRLCAKYGY